MNVRNADMTVKYGANARIEDDDEDTGTPRSLPGRGLTRVLQA